MATNREQRERALDVLYKGTEPHFGYNAEQVWLQTGKIQEGWEFALARAERVAALIAELDELRAKVGGAP